MELTLLEAGAVPDRGGTKLLEEVELLELVEYPCSGLFGALKFLAGEACLGGGEVRPLPCAAP
jgi:hypothetical protein